MDEQVIVYSLPLTLGLVSGGPESVSSQLSLFKLLLKVTVHEKLSAQISSRLIIRP